MPLADGCTEIWHIWHHDKQKNYLSMLNMNAGNIHLQETEVFHLSEHYGD
jgi:hypothetical protein